MTPEIYTRNDIRRITPWTARDFYWDHAKNWANGPRVRLRRLFSAVWVDGDFSRQALRIFVGRAREFYNDVQIAPNSALKGPFLGSLNFGSTT